ncbi:hypothetical protein K504DRAFT_467224 [Pleomassaria siparia CBS 279.74]|uniref:Uncharacterized protein n=1 Tax=Pleomassaria siparia CBS 279.74 TaxID=1314801 RepID=A0A6G1K9W3_9PLEO|nr:hypothetical protein K504DRAFT_467224 [Pleomassaria siparia CBS 279.74]
MLGFRPLRVAKRKQPYKQVPITDIEDADYDEKYDSDDLADYLSSDTSSPSSSRTPSGIPLTQRRKSVGKATVSAYSYKNPRAFTRYFGLAVGSTLVLFILFLTKASWVSIRSAELGLHKAPAPPPVWESFPFLKRYHGGIRTLVSRDENKPEYPQKNDIDPEMPATPDVHKVAVRDKKEEYGPLPASVEFDPYPKYESEGYMSKYGPVETCYLDANSSIRIPPLRVYNGVTRGLPNNVMGSYDLLGLRNDVCFERFGRLGPYGLGYSKVHGGTGAGMEGDKEGSELVWGGIENQIDFRSVRWSEALERCLDKNADRFKPMTKGRNHFYKTMAMKGPSAEKVGATPAQPSPAAMPQKPDIDRMKRAEIIVDKATNTTVAPKVEVKAEPKAEPKEELKADTKPMHKNLLPRTAVLIRTWWDYNYDDEDIMFLRSIITELSIASGGEYVVHFLIHVKDDNKQIWADDEVYATVLKNSLPEEFEGMGTLWSERQMGLIYGGVEESMYRNLPVHGAYRSTYMPVTYFAHQHPEYDFFWHWEMDVRYTGHYYHLFSQVAAWSDKQPRKGLWERNSRFYVPAVHGSWDDFSHMVRIQTEHGTNSKSNQWSSHLPPNPNLPEPETQRPEKPIWGPEIPLDYPDIEIDPDVKPQTTFTEDQGTWGVDEPADLIVFNPLFDPDHTNWILNNDVTGYNTTRGYPPRRTAINTSGRLSRRLLETMHREQSIYRHTMFSEMWPASCALHHGLKAVYAPHPVYVDRKWPVQYLAAIFNNGRNGASGGARLSVFSDERQHNFLGTTWYYHAGFAPNLWKRWLGYKVDNDGGEAEELENEGRMCLPATLLHPVKQVDLIQEKLDDTGAIVDKR